MSSVPTTAARAGFAAALTHELAPRALLESLTAALILYLLVAITSVSIAALVYAGPLTPQLPRALAGVLVGVALLTATVSLLGDHGCATATTQDASGVILALGAAAAAAALPHAAPEARAATVALLLLVVTLGMGLVYVLLSAFRLGALVRFLPLPVMGGFLAGTGWLIVIGGLGVAAGAPFGPALLEPGPIARCLPALLLGLAMRQVVRRWRNAALLAVLCAAAAALFYGAMAALGQGPSELADDGWLLGPFSDALAWHPPLEMGLSGVDWRALVAALPVALPAILIGALALLLNTSALELIVKRDIAVDRDLLVHGVANIGSALAGGLIGYTAISMSSVGYTLAGGRRLPGLLVALLLLATALLGTDAIAAVPRFVMGGLLVFIGLALLDEWLWQARRTMRRGDYAVVLAIFAVIAVEDFLWGVALGVVAAIVRFVVDYSRIDIVRFELGGDRLRSRVQRGARQREWLQAQGARVWVVKLQGFVFFGTASRLVDRLRPRLAAGRRFLLLDFEQVTGLDSTALLCFDKLGQQARQQGVELVLSGLRPRVAAAWQRAGEAMPSSFADLDRGLEWCEQRLLDEAGLAGGDDEPVLRDQLLALLPDPPRIDALLARMTRREIAAGASLIAEGDAPDALFVVESGQLTARLERGPGAAELRLETMRAGSLIGEIGFVLDTPRSAGVVADMPSVVRELDRATWRRIVADEPLVAHTLDTLLLRLLAQRTIRLTGVVDALQR